MSEEKGEGINLRNKRLGQERNRSRSISADRHSKNSRDPSTKLEAHTPKSQMMQPSFVCRQPKTRMNNCWALADTKIRKIKLNGRNAYHNVEPNNRSTIGCGERNLITVMEERRDFPHFSPLRTLSAEREHKFRCKSSSPTHRHKMKMCATIGGDIWLQGEKRMRDSPSGGGFSGFSGLSGLSGPSDQQDRMNKLREVESQWNSIKSNLPMKLEYSGSSQVPEGLRTPSKLLCNEGGNIWNTWGMDSSACSNYRSAGGKEHQNNSNNNNYNNNNQTQESSLQERYYESQLGALSPSSTYSLYATQRNRNQALTFNQGIIGKGCLGLTIQGGNASAGATPSTYHSARSFLHTAPNPHTLSSTKILNNNSINPFYSINEQSELKRY